MRFGTFRATFRVANAHFGDNYRKAYHTVRTISAVFPHVGMRTNPLTLRLEAAAANRLRTTELFLTSINSLNTVSPASELSGVDNAGSVSDWLLNLMEEYQLVTMPSTIFSTKGLKTMWNHNSTC